MRESDNAESAARDRKSRSTSGSAFSAFLKKTGGTLGKGSTRVVGDGERSESDLIAVKLRWTFRF